MDKMKDLAQWGIEKAKAAGADQSWTKVSRDRFVEISYRNHKPQKISEASSKNFAIGIFVDGRYLVQSSADTRKTMLSTFIQKAVQNARLLAKDEARTLPDPKYYKGQSSVDLQMVDPAYSKMTPEDRHVIARTIEGACLAAGGDKVISVESGEYDSLGESVLMTSNGFFGQKAMTEFWAGAEMTARDAGDRRPNGWHWIGATKKSLLEDPKTIGKIAAARTLDLMGAKKIDTGKMPIIIENRNVNDLLSGLLDALMGYNIQQHKSFLADKKGKRIASEKLTLVNDPLVVHGLSSTLYDSDGMAAKKLPLIENGVLKNHLVDWYYSRKLKVEPTTGDLFNLVIPPGTKSVEQLMKELGRGIFITGFLGGNSNSATGDFSIGILGKYFENGQPVQSVAEMNIAGNHLEFWNKLIDAADDPWQYGHYIPSVVIDDVLVSGV